MSNCHHDELITDYMKNTQLMASILPEELQDPNYNVSPVEMFLKRNELKVSMNITPTVDIFMHYGNLFTYLLLDKFLWQCRITEVDSSGISRLQPEVMCFSKESRYSYGIK